jgi:hypothetical protein
MILLLIPLPILRHKVMETLWMPGHIRVRHSFPDMLLPPPVSGSQTTIDCPSLEVKEQKKLSLPTFDPQKVWHETTCYPHQP